MRKKNHNRKFSTGLKIHSRMSIVGADCISFLRSVKAHQNIHEIADKTKKNRLIGMSNFSNGSEREWRFHCDQHNN